PAAVSLEGSEWRPALNVPDPDRPVMGGAGKAFAVGTEAHGIDHGRVALEGGLFHAPLGVPDQHFTGLTGNMVLAPTAGDSFAVGAEAHIVDGERVSFKGARPLA